MKTCFFIGHRDADVSLLPQIEAAVLRHITEYGVQEFVVGQHGAFDRMAANAVLRAKQQFPSVTLTVLLAYHPAERPACLPDGCSSTLYPPGQEQAPRRAAIVRANRYMVDHSDHLIAFVRYPGGARDVLDYARRREQKGLLTVQLL